MTADAIAARLIALGNPDDAIAKTRFFKAGPGGYADGDQFAGVSVPKTRALAKQVRDDVTLDDIEDLLDHPVHEVRLLAAILLADLSKPRRTPQHTKDAIVALVIRRADDLDNWDLVDTVAPHTLGPWLVVQDDATRRATLDPLISSENLWRRRLAMVAMLGPIRAGESELPLDTAHRLLGDEHDLIHRATGWMLREIGLRDRAALDDFLERYADTMPRTALRYALEKHTPDERRAFMGRR
ncbi:DNA alkylation repair protein [Mariniluteicoccus endophyticus]